MKNLKFLCFIICFSFFFSFPVSAAEPDLLPTSDLLREQLGLSQEEFDSMFNDEGIAIIDSPVPYTTSTIEEDISLQSGGIQYSYMNDTGTGVTGFIQFGSSILVKENARMLKLILYNDENLLFTEPGILLLNCYLYAFSTQVVLYHADGTTESFVYSADLTENINTLKINNNNADLVKIEIVLQNPISSEGDLVLGAGIISYSYDIVSIFQTISNFFSSFFSNLQDTLTDFFGEVSNSDTLNSSIDSVDSLENNLVELSGNIDEFEFDLEVLSNTKFLAAMSWVSSLLELLFNGSRFSIVFKILLGVLVASILLGFARLWKGGKS